MSWPRLQAIDCDIHPSVPGMRALLPYLDDHWRGTVEDRGIASLESISYPRNAPLTARPDWRDESGQAATDLAAVRTQLLDQFGVRLAICNCLYGVQLVFDAYMAKAFASALNDWIAREWLDPEPRLRASIVVPLQDPEFAVEEIERCAPDRRFVQVLVLAMGELPLGRRAYWPVYAAALRHGLPIGIHAGSSYRHPVTSVGWPTTYAEDYASQAQGFQAQLTSLITEGVFRAHVAVRRRRVLPAPAWSPCPRRAAVGRRSRLVAGYAAAWSPPRCCRRHVAVPSRSRRCAATPLSCLRTCLKPGWHLGAAQLDGVCRTAQCNRLHAGRHAWCLAGTAQRALLNILQGACEQEDKVPYACAPPEKIWRWAGVCVLFPVAAKASVRSERLAPAGERVARVTGPGSSRQD